MTAMWMVRAGRGADKLEFFRSASLVSIGSHEHAALPKSATREELTAIFRGLTPEAKDGQVRNWASQAYRFAYEVQVGDRVLTYNPERREYLLGTIASEYEWRPSDDIHGR